MNPESSFAHFPKQRPSLSAEMAEVYAQHYKANRQGETAATSVAQRMETWLHRQVARDLRDPKGARRAATLELGAGPLNQLPYEPEAAPYDIVEPYETAYEGSPRLSRIRAVYGDITDVPSDARYDRITSVATLEHICNLPEVVARAGLLLADGGTFRAAIPSEGTFLWTLGWKLTTAVEFRLRHGLDYGVLMKYEHVNTAQEIEDVLDYFFDKVSCRVFGLSKAICFYRFYECGAVRLDRCREYLQTLRDAEAG